MLLPQTESGNGERSWPSVCAPVSRRSRCAAAAACWRLTVSIGVAQLRAGDSQRGLAGARRCGDVPRQAGRAQPRLRGRRELMRDHEVEDTLRALYAAIEERDGRWWGKHGELLLSSSFQPVYSFPHGRPVGYEALIRVADPAGLPVSPISLFEQVGSFDEQVKSGPPVSTRACAQFLRAAQRRRLAIPQYPPGRVPALDAPGRTGDAGRRPAQPARHPHAQAGAGGHRGRDGAGPELRGSGGVGAQRRLPAGARRLWCRALELRPRLAHPPGDRQARPQPVAPGDAVAPRRAHDGPGRQPAARMRLAGAAGGRRVAGGGA